MSEADRLYLLQAYSRLRDYAKSLEEALEGILTAERGSRAFEAALKNARAAIRKAKGAT